MNKKLESELEKTLRCVAIKFLDKESKELGAKILLIQVDQYVAIGRGIRILSEKDIEFLDHAGLKYEKYYLRSQDLTDVYKNFNVENPFTSKPQVS